jgi:hypothetical protein
MAFTEICKPFVGIIISSPFQPLKGAEGLNKIGETHGEMAQ